MNIFPPTAAVSRWQTADEWGSVSERRRIFVFDKMTEKLEQRYCIKFCVKFGDSQVETIRKIQQAFGNEAMGTTQIKEWYNRFIDGRLLDLF